MSLLKRKRELTVSGDDMYRHDSTLWLVRVGSHIHVSSHESHPMRGQTHGTAELDMTGAALTIQFQRSYSR